MKTRLLSVFASLLVVASVAIAPAFSAGGGGGGGGGGSGGGSGGGGGGSSGGGGSIAKCKAGTVLDRRTRKCVVPRQGLLDDDSLYEAGRELAMAGRYGEAITVLTLAANKSDARILNYLGYSHRKQGRIMVGLGYYREALHNDPEYVPAREYMGEAYLQLGDIASARGQLTEIEKRCGKTCEEYQELAKQIESLPQGI
jgi:Tetratricopeptide repeat